MNKTLKRIFFTVIILTAAALLFSFTAAARQRGDVDEDGIVTPADARMALRMSVGLDKSAKDVTPVVPYTERERDIADMDMDLAVTPEDARVILRTAVKVEDALPYYAYTIVETKEPVNPATVELISHNDGIIRVRAI